MVLAAGKSTRVASVAPEIPKPLIELAGDAVILRNLRWLASQGIRDVWVNIHYRGELIEDAVGHGSRWGIQIRYSREEQILGTAGAVRKLKAEWTSPFWVVYGDNLVRFSLDSMAATHVRGHFALTMALFDRTQQPNTGIAGGRVELDADERVLAFLEGNTREQGAFPFVNAGVYLITPAVVDAIPEDIVYDFGRDLFPALLKDGIRLGGHLIDGYCLGIDTPESYAKALAMIAEGKVILS